MDKEILKLEKELPEEIVEGCRNEVLALKLDEYGIITVPILDTKELREKVNKECKETVKTFPEYNRDTKNPTLTKNGNKVVYTLGGFGAMGNPSSFHNPLVRKLREWCMSKVVPILRDYIKRKYKKDASKYRLESLIDRFSIRREGTAPTKESWHRDVTKDMEKGEIIFGGWINLDVDNSQYFSCVPTTHNDIEPWNIKSGFDIFPKKAHSSLKDRSVLTEIPPGNLVIFPQHIAHEVMSKKNKKDSYRLYMGWRLTKRSNSLYNNVDTVIKQDVIKLPSGQGPPLYAANHMSFFLNKQITIDPTHKKLKQNLKEWSVDTFKSKLLVDKINKKGETYTVIPRFMKSLKDYNFKLYPKYDKDEKKIIIPNREWMLKEPGTGVRKKYKL